MSLAHHFASTASLIAHPSRALMLDALMGKSQLNVTELAVIADISKQTASHHLKRMYEANLLSIKKVGKQTFYALKNQAVADILQQLALLQLAIKPNHNSATNVDLWITTPLSSLQNFRVCYGHMAGEVAIEVTTALISGNLLIMSDDQTQVTLTIKGHEWLQALGVDTQNHPDNSPTCMDWTEQQPHISGWLGHELLARLIQLNLVKPCNFKPRQLSMTSKGRLFFQELCHNPRVTTL